jgi:hypothetical protein
MVIPHRSTTPNQGDTMTIKTRKLAALLSATALIGGVGIATAADGGNGNGGKRGGPPKVAIAKIATALGVTNAELKSALEAGKPERPAKGERPGPEAFAADIAEALGVEASAVTPILEANKPARPTTKPKKGSRPPRPDHTALIAALAEGLSIDQSTVEAAFTELEADHKAEHDARHTAMYTAVAEALGKTVAEVQAAFEANRPAKPTS